MTFAHESEAVQVPLRLELLARNDLQHHQGWQVAFANERKDHRYYELVEDTLHPEFNYRYFVIKDAIGQVCAVQPAFSLDQDLLVGVSPRFGTVIDAIRRIWPRLMRARTLMWDVSPVKATSMPMNPVIAPTPSCWLQS
jgi:hypothetical protein